MAPELFDERVQATQKSDVYAFSICVYQVFMPSETVAWRRSLTEPQILSDKKPFDITEDHSICVLHTTFQRPPYQKVIEGPMWNLIKHCWEQKAQERPHMRAVITLVGPLRSWVELYG